MQIGRLMIMTIPFLAEEIGIANKMTNALRRVGGWKGWRAVGAMTVPRFGVRLAALVIDFGIFGYP
jgi:hypothetical protein